jgi:hypothetical protein
VLTSGASHSRDAPGTLNRHVIMVSVICAEDEYTTGCTITSRPIPVHLNPPNHRPDCFNIVSDFSYQCRSFPYRAVLHRNPPKIISKQTRTSRAYRGIYNGKEKAHRTVE